MNNIELALITKIVDDRDFHTLEKAKIDEEYFQSPEAKEAYRFIRDMYHANSTAGCIPSRELLAAYYPTFPFFNSSDNIAVLIEQLRRSRISMEVSLLAQRLINNADLAPLEALATLRADGPRIASLAERSEDFSMSAAARLLRNRYDMVAEAKGVIGIPYPWDVLNEATQGMKPQNFIVIYGRPKSMKTWFALKLAVHAYIACRRRVLFYSREMAPEELLGRAASIIAKVDYNEFLNGRLQPSVRDHLFNILNELIEDEKVAGSSNTRQPFFVVVSDRDSPDGGGISWLQAKIEEHDPDIAFVDGMYLMKDDRTRSRTVDWKNITHISQDTKLTARRFNIPIVGVTQANRGAEGKTGEDLTELAFADALGMDADAVFRVSKHPKIDEATKRKVTELLITAPGLREGLFEGMVLEACPGHTFDLLRVLTGLDPREREANYKEGGGQAQQQQGPARLVPRGQFNKNGNFRDPKLR